MAARAAFPTKLLRIHVITGSQSDGHAVLGSSKNLEGAIGPTFLAIEELAAMRFIQRCQGRGELGMLGFDHIVKLRVVHSHAGAHV